MQDKVGKKALAVLILGYTLCFSILAIERHKRMETSIFDLGIFDQALYLLTQDDSLFLTTRGLHIHGNHFHPILYLFAPLYLLWPSVNLLLIAQTLVLALGAYPAYLLARHYKFSEGWSAVVAALYLAHPAVGFLNRFDFHPVSVIVPALLFAILYLEQDRPLPYAASLVVALACTEAAGFTVIALAVTAWWVRDKRWFFGTFGLGVAGILTSKFWLRYFTESQGSPYGILYTNYGKSEAEVVVHLLSQPIDTFVQLCTPLNLEYLFYLVGPLVFLPLLAPDRLLPAVPVLLGNLLSWRYSQHRIEFHYGAALAPFLLWAAVVGWSRVRERGVPTRLIGGLAVLAVFLSTVFGAAGFKHTSRLDSRASLTTAKKQVREGEMVVADNSLGVHFSQREEVYLFPNPFVSVAWGSTSQSLIQQSSNEYRPLYRGTVRRGLEAVPVDCMVLPVDPERRSDFPLVPGDSSMARAEALRSALFEMVTPVEGDAFVIRRRSKP
jgi:uncharacterized membrane protein